MWQSMVAVINAEAGMTLAVILRCEDCGREFPGSPRLRVARCFPCRDAQTRQRRALKRAKTMSIDGEHDTLRTENPMMGGGRRHAVTTSD